MIRCIRMAQFLQDSMTTPRKVLSNTGFQIAGKVLTAGFGILVVKILSGYLGKAGYGDYVTVFVFLSFFGMVADMGLFTLTVREMSKHPERVPYIISNILGLRLFLAVGSMTLAVIVAFILPFFSETWRESMIPLGVAIAGIGTVFSIMSGTVSSVLQVHYKMLYETLGQIIAKIVAISYMIYVAYIGYVGDIGSGFNQILWGGVIGSMCMFLTTFNVARRLAPLRISFDFAFWKETFIEALPFGIALVLNVFYFKLDIILLKFMKGSEEVGIYGVAMKMLEVLYFLPVYFMNSMLPVITHHLKEATGKIQQILQYAFDFLMLSAVPIVVGGFVLAYPIIFVISDPQYLSRLSEGFYGSDIALRILIFALLFSFLNAMFAIVLIVLSQQKRLMIINFFGLILNLVLNILVIPQFGFRGAAVTSVISAFCVLIATYKSVNKQLPLHFSFLSSAKIILSALTMGVFVYALRDPTYVLWQNANLALLMPLGGIIYVAMLFGTRVITKDMLKTLLRKSG